MYVPSFIRIERGSDGAHDFENNKVPLFGRITGNINTSMSGALKLALLPASRYYCIVNMIIPQCRCPVLLRLKEVQMEAHDYKYNKVPLLARKIREYQYFDVYCPESSSCASKPL